MNTQEGSQQVEPSNPGLDYREVQEHHSRKAQTSPDEEAAAGIKLVPRPEDVTSFESAAEPDTPANNRHTGYKGETVGNSIDRDPRERKHRAKEVSDGHSDQRRGFEYTHESNTRA